MYSYIARRCLIMIPTLIVISMLVFVVIELPPGDVVAVRLQKMMRMNETEEMIQNMRHRYGLDKPPVIRYWRWSSRFARGDFGYSLSWNRHVHEIIGERFLLTAFIALLSLLFTWIMAFPIGVFSAVRQYSIGDYFWTVVGFMGLAIPNFLLALVLMFLSYKYFPDLGVGGLFSTEFEAAPWSFAKFLNLLGHLWVPVLVVGTAGTAGLVRIVRANLIDELKKPYVEMARSKGLPEARVIFKYPLRIAINPFLSTVGWVLPSLISGTVITAVVLGLPTAGPIFLEALRAQDMQLAGAFVMLSAALAVIGTLASDILLVMVDPRIKYA